MTFDASRGRNHPCCCKKCWWSPFFTPLLACKCSVLSFAYTVYHFSNPKRKEMKHFVLSSSFILTMICFLRRHLSSRGRFEICKFVRIKWPPEQRKKYRAWCSWQSSDVKLDRSWSGEWWWRRKLCAKVSGSRCHRESGTSLDDSNTAHWTGNFGAKFWNTRVQYGVGTGIHFYCIWSSRQRTTQLLYSVKKACRNC